MNPNGKVYLVGAGPGDPDLLTLKALRLLRAADVVLHDDLVPPEILKFASPWAQIQNVGKRAGSKAISQPEINFLMIARAAAGLQVVRLKSGDPLIFGRAGEEIEALRQANINYEIVPGVTSAFGAAASAGIPLTHREVSSTLILAAGHYAPGANKGWGDLAAGKSTLIVYMPGQDYAALSAKFKLAGFHPSTPCAVISKATTQQQETHHTTVGQLHRTPTLAAPTLVIVGEVVGLARRDSFPEAQSTSAVNPELQAALLSASHSRESFSLEEPRA